MLPKITTAFLALGFFGFDAAAQLNIQSGATFVMQSGAQVTVQGDVQNAGTLTNDGNLKVQGNYANTGSYTGVGAAGVLEMYGTGNSNITPGASSIPNLLINKTGATDVVKLMASTTVTNGFTLTNGVFTTDPLVTPAVALISPATTPYTFAAGKEVVGSVRRTSWTAASSRVFNATHMQVATNGGTAPTDVTVTMIPQSAGGDPTQAEREVKRKYTFTQTGGSGFTADIRYPYLTGELNTNTEANLVPWRLAAAEWNARLTPVTRDAGNDWVNTTGITAADFALEWKLADPNYTMNVTANLRGPWNGAAMNTTVRDAGIVSLTQPFNTTPFNYTGTESVGAIPANVVDWVLIEHRKPASGLASDALVATITGRQAGFLLNNGSVVGLDGITPISIPIAKQGAGFLAVRHRNHLGVLSNSLPSNATGSYTNDFTVLANAYKPVGASSDPLELLAGGTEYGLWSGDANKSGIVNATDINVVRADIALSSTGYLLTDINLSNTINATDINFIRNTISQSGSGSGTEGRMSAPMNKSKVAVKTNLPDPIIEQQ